MVVFASQIKYIYNIIIFRCVTTTVEWRSGTGTGSLDDEVTVDIVIINSF